VGGATTTTTMAATWAPPPDPLTHRGDGDDDEEEDEDFLSSPTSPGLPFRGGGFAIVARSKPLAVALGAGEEGGISKQL